MTSGPIINAGILPPKALTVVSNHNFKINGFLADFTYANGYLASVCRGGDNGMLANHGNIIPPGLTLGCKNLGNVSNGDELMLVIPFAMLASRSTFAAPASNTSANLPNCNHFPVWRNFVAVSDTLW
jgi:hypothetical protein